MNRFALVASGRAPDPGGSGSNAPTGLTAHPAPSRLTLLAGPGLDWIAGRQSLLIGRLFDRTTDEPVLSATALDEAVAGGLDALVHHYWGSYLLVTEMGRDLILFRDPSGAIPCYRVGQGEEMSFCSDAETALALGLLEDPQIDAEFLAHWLCYSFLRSLRTGLAGVSELMPGAAHMIDSNNASDRQIWKPSSFTRPVDSGPDALRQLALRSVATIAGDKPILLQISGGLDSSIIAACLAAAKLPVRAVSFATRSSEGDERRYAKAVCDHLGIELEILEESDANYEASITPTFRPSANILLEPIDGAIEKFRRRAGAETIVDGGGGDSLFGFSHTAAAVLDGLRVGRGREMLQAVAERSDETLWRVLAVTVRQGLQRPLLWKRDDHFLHRAALPDRPDHHPWLAGSAKLWAGKREQLTSLVHILHFLDRHRIGGDHRHPLMNQLLLEHCLSVPSWQWNQGGRDRALARHAFAPLLPSVITGRRTKGSLQGYFHRRFRPMKPGITELLLEGRLAAAGLIDRRTIEQALTSGDGPGDETAMRLSEIATLERWLSDWHSVGAS